MSSFDESRIQNDVLRALAPEEYRRLNSCLKRMRLSIGEVLCEADTPLEAVHFPTTAVISLVCTTSDGASAEIGSVGREGFFGLPIVLGARSMPNSAVTQIAGETLSIRVGALQEELGRGGTLQRLLLLYANSFLSNLSHTSACNRLHSIERRLSKWLLLCQDRTGSEDLCVTQEFLAQMLGVRRESITVAAGRMQDEGMIHYCRGRVRILDREGMEANACECYEAVRTKAYALRGAIR